MMHFRAIAICTYVLALSGSPGQVFGQKPTEMLLEAIEFSRSGGNQAKQLSIDTLNLPFSDDFSAREGYPNPALWRDEKVWINNTYGREIPTLGVATFDGLDEDGLAYDLADNSSDTIADVLTSQAIRLQPGMTGVRLSFEYQAGGRGEAPEADDRLALQFYAPADSQWTEVWSASGPAFEGFKSAIVAVDSSIWLLPGFQFRLAAYGARSGAFDIWNIDYVRLDQNRSAGDTLFTDAAFTREHPSLINGYFQVPWNHIGSGSNRFVNQFGLHYRKNGPPGSISINLGRYIIEQDGLVIASKNGNPDNAPPYNTENVRTVLVDPFSISPPTAPFRLRIRSIMDGANDGFRSNDTVEITHDFSNYYAYDDGSAERVYGLSNTPGARTAVAFAPFRSDSLKGFQIQFVPTQFDARQNSFRMAVWEYNSGVPGNLVYLSDSLYKPAYYGTDRPISYGLDTSAIFISGPFFIGLIQTTIQPLNIGLDVNQADQDSSVSIFYGDAANWYSSLFPGRLMLRPYFGTQPDDLSRPDPATVRGGLKLMPNPAGERLTVQAPGMGSWVYEVYSVEGLGLIRAEAGDTVDLNTESLSPGIYVLRAYRASDGRALSAKFLRR